MSYLDSNVRTAGPTAGTTRPVAEPVAVVGMACRLPGAPNLDAFWDLLARGGDAITEGVPNHMDHADWGAVRTAVGNPEATRLGGFLDRIDEYDAHFFGNSPREATRMSPVHRLMMESVWEAVEDSGTTAGQLAGSRTSVYTSCLLNSEYWDMLVDSGLHDLHALIGSVMHGAAAGRIAYTFDLRGPTMAVDATCAGSLMAVHLACRSIRCGESDMAIVGSVNLQLDALHTAALARGRVISPTGTCRFGDTGADGYVRSDGAVAVVLKPLRAALADGDRIHATILGSGASSSGSGSSLVAPSRTGQAVAIRAALADAGVRPDELSYVEAHGTGTAEGDRTELAALGDVLADVETPCLIGSAKSNVGHTEAAAGVVGLIKTALALRHRTIPPTVHVREPNALLTDMPLRLADTIRPWPARNGRRVAGVSSFGMSGTNVHLVIAEAPTTEPPKREGKQVTFVLPVSARAVGAVRDLSRAYGEQVSAATTEELSDICFSAGVRRTHHEYRMAVVASDGMEMAARLGEYAWGRQPEAVVASDRKVFDSPRVVFVFPGQGGQWTGMGRELYRTNAVFRDRVHECDSAVRAERGWSIVDKLMSDEPLVYVDEVQPVLWAVEVGLAAVWRDWGLEPDMVVGHSMGEVAAATVIGALTVRQAAAVICRRSSLVRRIHQPGGMVAVQLGEAEARSAIGEFADRVTVAVVNSPHSTVLAGDVEALAQVVGPLRARGVFCRDVAAGFASHGPAVEPLRGPLRAALTGLRPRRATIPMLSTAIGCELDGSELDGRYWMTNLREPVRFADAVRTILADGRRTLFVEVSAHPVLTSAIQEVIGDGASDVVASLCRGEDDEQALARGVATAYVQGCELNWARLNPGGRYVTLPSYPWQRKRFWVTAAAPQPEPAPVPTPAGPVDVEHQFVQAVADLLTMRPEEVDPKLPLPFLGMDSVLAVRLHSKLKRDMGIELPVHDMLGSRTVAELARDLAPPPPAA